MNCLAWNCQGLGGPLTVHNLEFHIREHNPLIIFLSETKCKWRKIELLKNRLNFSGVSVDAKGKSGGLALLWRKDLIVDLQSFSFNHIDAFVFGDADPIGWRVTGFCGEPDTSKWTITWDLLKRLSGHSFKPWLCMGDFNEILNHSEKEGGNINPNFQLRNFRNALQDSGLSDLGFYGYPYTWTNGWDFPHTVKERLDRACATNSWIQRFPHSRVEHLKFGGSDHAPILIQALDKENQHVGRKKVKRFMFESMWLESDECSNLVQNSWQESFDRPNALDKLQFCSKELEVWSIFSFGSINHKIRKLREKIHALRTGVVTVSSKHELDFLTMKLKGILDKEEKMCQQRAKAHWMREGDRNTRYFHSRAIGRNKKNEIRGLRKGDGSWCDTDPEIEAEIVNYFQSIFTSSHPSEEDLNVVLSVLSPRVSFENNQYLLQPYTADDVYRALISMHPLKSTGPDGFPPLFFQKFWNSIGPDITSWVLNFLNNDVFDENSNFTNVALIPKCKNPEDLTQFRPISLCNVIYKIASKTIANRLKPIMNSIISDYQSAFVPGRQITDNVLVAYEISHYMKTLTKGDVGQMAIKLDMS